MKRNSMLLKNLSITSTDICLISMPFADPTLPSPALGLLKAVLVNAGIQVSNIYAYLFFAEQLGIEAIQRINQEKFRFPLDEWVFASTAFPEHNPDEDLFLREVYPIGKAQWQTKEEFRDELRHFRSQAIQYTTQIAEYVLSLSPKVVGCSSCVSQRVPSLAMLRTIKKLNPQVITVLGGVDCDTIMGKTAHEKFTWVDYVVSGEAEDIIVPLIKGIFKSGRKMALHDLPKGVFAPIHRELGYPKPIPRASASSFSEQITPCYDEYFQSLEILVNLKKTIRPSLPVQSSRGCWYGKCRFCALNPYDIPHRSRPAKDIIAELQNLSEKYKVKHFVFMDTIFDMEYFDTLIPELIELGAPYTLFLEVYPNLSQEQVTKLRQAGVIFCQPGIESLHSDILKALGKGLKAYKNLEIMKWCRQFGIRISWAFLHGFPGENDNWYGEMADFIPLLEHLSPPLGLGTVLYERGSHYFQYANDYDLELVPLLVQKLIYPLSPADLKAYLHAFLDKRNIAESKNPFLHKPGLERLHSAINIWKKSFEKTEKPVLAMTTIEEEIRIRDTRSVATAPSFCFTGLEKDLYLSCILAQDETKLKLKYRKKGVSPHDVDLVIENFVKNHLMIWIDGRLLSLAVEEPMLEYVL